MFVKKLDTPSDVISSINKVGNEPRTFTLKLSDFKLVYFELAKLNPGLLLDIILNGDWALIQFSEINNNLIRVIPNNNFHVIYKFFGIHLYIDKTDFEFVSPYASFWGQKEKYSFVDFLFEELKVNGIKFILSLIIAFATIFFIISKSGNNEYLSIINQVIISIATIFFGIFILFTASQNIQAISNPNLFNYGLMHRFLLIDKYITKLSTTMILITVINIILTLSNNILLFEFIPTNLHIFSIKNIVILLTSFVLTSIFFGMITVEQYYFERMRTIIENDSGKELLRKRFDDVNKFK